MKRDALHFVLVGTQFASNLGTAVRAMKNLGFERLVLVNPECEVGVEARARAMKGAPILDRARFFPSLEAAQQEIGVLVGTTGRYQGGHKNRPLHLRGFASQVLPELSDVPLGIVFGPEDNGLRRRDLKLCQYLTTIPAGSEFPVMNLSQAVAVVAYELHLAMGRATSREEKLKAAAPEEIQTLLGAVEQRLGEAALPHYLASGRLMNRIRRLAARTPLESEDVKMFLALLQWDRDH